jgi:hypothetical protein
MGGPAWRLSYRYTLLHATSCGGRWSAISLVVRAASSAVRHRAFVEATPGSQSLGAKVIVPVVDAEKSTSVLSFAGLVGSCVCLLMLSGGAIAMANAIVGTVPCSKS